MNEDYLKYAAVFIVAALVGGAATYTQVDQSDALQDQGETITELNSTVGELETQAANLRETVNEQASTIADQESTIESVKAERDALRDDLEAVPNYQPVVDADSSNYVSYYPGAERDVTVEVEVNEQIREGQSETYTVEYDVNEEAVSSTSVEVYDGAEDTFRTGVGDGHNEARNTFDFEADEAGTYYVEFSLDLAEESDVERAEELVDDGFNLDTEAANDYYTVVR